MEFNTNFSILFSISDGVPCQLLVGCRNWFIYISISLFISALNFFILSTQRLRWQTSKASPQPPPILSRISHCWSPEKQPHAPQTTSKSPICTSRILPQRPALFGLYLSSGVQIAWFSMHWIRKEKNYTSITIQKASKVQIKSRTTYITSLIFYISNFLSILIPDRYKIVSGRFYLPSSP